MYKESLMTSSGKETVEKHWDFFARKDLFYDFQRIDSTNMSVEETADIIFQACSKNE
jgi:regulator of PEP synthase PpsR (kinase-PPPase family)